MTHEQNAMPRLPAELIERAAKALSSSVLDHMANLISLVLPYAIWLYMQAYAHDPGLQKLVYRTNGVEFDVLYAMRISVPFLRTLSDRARMNVVGNHIHGIGGLDPEGADAARHCMVFLQELPDAVEQWIGHGIFVSRDCATQWLGELAGGWFCTGTGSEEHVNEFGLRSEKKVECRRIKGYLEAVADNPNITHGKPNSVRVTTDLPVTPSDDANALRRSPRFEATRFDDPRTHEPRESVTQVLSPAPYVVQKVQAMVDRVRPNPDQLAKLLNDVSIVADDYAGPGPSLPLHQILKAFAHIDRVCGKRNRECGPREFQSCLLHDSRFPEGHSIAY